MSREAVSLDAGGVHPVHVAVRPQTEDRDRLTTLFRAILAIPHLLLVGGPLAATMFWGWTSESGWRLTTGGGVLGAVAALCAVIAWFAILFTGRYPDGLRSLVALYLRWRVRAVAYTALLRDEYPPFGDTDYPAAVTLGNAREPRDRVSVGFRIILAIPHLIIIWALGVAWFFTTVFAWFSILFTASYPRSLYDFGVGVLRWNTRVEAYLLLLHDEYPPFTLSETP
jgi:hypothetical protein